MGELRDKSVEMGQIVLVYERHVCKCLYILF
jgi:hypothetical protein